MNLTFTYLVNNGGVAVNQVSAVCPAVNTALTGAGTAPLELSVKPTPDNGCALPGYYYWDASVADRAGNTASEAVVGQVSYGYEPGTATVNFVNLNPFYGGGDPASVTVFASHTGADLADARLGMNYTTSGGNAAEFRFRSNGVFGAPWDNALYLATPAAGVQVIVPGNQVLGAIQDGANPVAPGGAATAMTSFNVEAIDVYGTPSAAFNAPIVAQLKNTKFSTQNVWATPNIGTPTFSGSGACTFDYSTPTNGPTIPALVWVVDNSAAGVYDFVTVLTGAPALISDNGIQRLYRYSVGGATCASLTAANNIANLRLVAIKNDTNGVPVGYIVP
jgi:hypothetical protein